MVDIINKEISTNDMKEVVNKLIPDSIAKDIEKACHGIYPLHDVYIRKVSHLLSIWSLTFIHITPKLEESDPL
jgi:small subunit ribosomal protein S3Ae